MSEAEKHKYLCMYLVYLLDAFFRQIKSFIRFRSAFVFGLQTYYLIYFSKIYPMPIAYQLKDLESKKNGPTNYYECSDLTQKHIYRNISQKTYLSRYIKNILLSAV